MRVRNKAEIANKKSTDGKEQKQGGVVHGRELWIYSLQVVQEAIAKASEGRTSILIAHRLATIKVKLVEIPIIYCKYSFYQFGLDR